MAASPAQLASPLGKPTDYAGHYDATRLFPIARAELRARLPALPMFGVDVWNAYELSWLRPGGLPQVALAEFRVPADSPQLIESKSLKLYLNGFMQTEFTDADAVRSRIAADLSAAAGAAVAVHLRPLDPPPVFGVLAGECIDQQPELAITRHAEPSAELLAIAGEDIVQETLVSHLFKSNCPVTGQPDWASVQISYRGPRLDRAALLRYLVAFREHADFHEHCVERIFCDLSQRLRPDWLSVCARYTRRGGLDINPLRCSRPDFNVDNPRLARQ